ncbi:MAG: hypothetical protein H6716_20680 [Polyangiaceae bacterium]|nr:hypothetical protein [Polyangiaceae bacterium]
MTVLHVAISPSPSETRVLAMASSTDTILKARLSPTPLHPRALSTLLEALALWQGQRVHAALVAGHRAGVSDLSPYRDAQLDGGALYRVAWVPACPVARRGRDITGLGAFADLRQVVLAEGLR